MLGSWEVGSGVAHLAADGAGHEGRELLKPRREHRQDDVAGCGGEVELHVADGGTQK